MVTVRLNNSFIRAGAVFRVPILSWTPEVPARFFRAAYGTLNEILYIQPSDFSAQGGLSLGDCSAALRIFGGNSTLTLRANGVIAEFPSVTPDRIPFVNSVIFQGYQALRTEFSELDIRSLESNAGHHLEIVGNGSVQEVLAGDRNKALVERAHKINDVVIEPATRFRIVSKEGKWHCKVTLERSEIIEDGVLLYREIVASDLSDCETTQQQFELIEHIDQTVLALTGLEPEIQGNAN